jgi:hypothetical protein
MDGTTINLHFLPILRAIVQSSGYVTFLAYWRDRQTGKIFPNVFNNHTTPNIAREVRAEAQIQEDLRHYGQSIISPGPPLTELFLLMRQLLHRP